MGVAPGDDTLCSTSGLQAACHYSGAASWLAPALIAAGADPHRRYRDGSLVDLALRLRRHDVVPLLFDHGVAPARFDVGGCTDRLIVVARLNGIEARARAVMEGAFWSALAAHDVDAVRALIAHGADIRCLRQQGGERA